MSNKLLRSIVENGNLTEFNTIFAEEVTSRVKAIIKEMEDEIKAEFDLSEEADIVGGAEKVKKNDKDVDREDAKDKGPSTDTDADDEDEDDEMEEKKASDVIYKDGVRYEYDGKTDLYYDSETDVYVTSKVLED